MENVYAVQCENLRIANMAFQAGSYEVAYEMLEALVHFVVSDEANKHIPDFVIVSPKSLRQRVLLFSDVLPSALFGCKSPCSEVA